MKFVLSKGLVTDFGSSDELKRKSLKLYRDFRREEGSGFRLSEWIRWAVYLLMWPFEPREIKVRTIPRIEFLGLWDTVDAYGMPIEEFKTGIDRLIWPLSLIDRILDERIRKACHALSIDDKRMAFHPLLWDETTAPHANVVEHTDDEILTQVWFAGAHGNVGGGYPDDGLSSVSLRWILDEAARRQLVFNKGALEELASHVAPFGRLYNPRAGLGAYYRYSPRRLDPPTDRQNAKILHPKIHESVIWRMALGTNSYSPLSLPPEIRIVTGGPLPNSSNGCGDNKWGSKNIYSLANYQTAVEVDGRLFGAHSGAGAETNEKQRAALDIGELQKPDPHAIELIWATVCWRQIAYFLAVAATVWLAIYPKLHLPAFVNPDVIDRLADYHSIQTVGKVAAAIAAFLQPVVIFTVNAAISLLPAATTPWLKTYLASSWDVALLCFLIALLLSWGSLLDRRINDRALAAWNKEWAFRRFKWLQGRATFRIVAGCCVAVVAAFVAQQFISLYSDDVLKAQLKSYDWFHCGEAAIEECEGDLEAIRQYDSALAVAFEFFAAFAAAIAGALSVTAVVYVIWAFHLAGQLKNERRELPGFALWLSTKASRWDPLRWLGRFTTRLLLPTTFAVTVMAAVLAFVNQFSLAVMSGMDFVCRATKPDANILSAGQMEEIPLKINEACQETSIKLSGGTSYLIEVRNSVSEVMPEGDWQQPHVTWLRRLATPFLRHLTARWFVPIVRVAGSTPEEFVIDGGRKTVCLRARGGCSFLSMML